MTEYEATQVQRNIERKIRRWKREYLAMEAAELDIQEAAAKIKSWQEVEKDFIKQTGLKRQSARGQVEGYTRKQATKVNKVLANTAKSGTIKLKDITVHRSVGASGKNYSVVLPSGKYVQLTEGTKITKIVAFAGKGTKKEIRVSKWLEKKYGIEASEWRKVRGDGYINEDGSSRHVELHWYEADNERVEMKVKRYFDEN